MKTAKTSFSAAIVGPTSSGTTSILNSILLFAVGLSLAGSGFSILRFTFLGLRVHTYLVVVGAFFPLLAITRLHLIPPRHLLEMFSLASLYFATTIPGGVSASEGIKIFAAMATIITMAMLVRNWDDFVMGVMGMCMAVGVLAVRGLDLDAAAAAAEGTLEEANRNTYSLFALPPILLGSYILIRARPGPLIHKLLIGASIIAAALAICLGLNRSGWLGLGVIGLMIIREKSAKAAVIAFVMGIGLYFLITTFFSSSTGQLQNRFADTRAGLESDKLRWNIIKRSLEIALENPLFGVSPQELPFEIADKMGFDNGYVASHNVFAHIAAGCGLIALFLMMHLGWTFWSWRPNVALPPQTRILFKESQKIMQLVLVLWLVRGCFTHEIIYSPGFCMAIGLALGLQLSYADPASVSAIRGAPPLGRRIHRRNAV